MNKLEFESDEVKAYVQQLQSENGILRQTNDEKNELLTKLGCPTTATARRKVFTLEQQLKRKEQECEELKKQLEEESKLGHKAIQDEAFTFFDLLKVQKELDRLKKENEKLIKTLGDEQIRRREYEMTLEEIREIAGELLQTKIPFCAIHEKIIEKINEVIDEH